MYLLGRASYEPASRRLCASHRNMPVMGVPLRMYVSQRHASHGRAHLMGACLSWVSLKRRASYGHASYGRVSHRQVPKTSVSPVTEGGPSRALEGLEGEGGGSARLVALEG